MYIITSGARLENMFCEYAKNIIICPSTQIDHSFSAIPKYRMYNLSKYLPILCSYTPKFESDLVGNSEERSFRDDTCHMTK